MEKENVEKLSWLGNITSLRYISNQKNESMSVVLYDHHPHQHVCIKKTALFHYSQSFYLLIRKQYVIKNTNKSTGECHSVDIVD